MKQTVTISSSRDLMRFRSDFVELIDIVRKVDGRYILSVNKKRRSFASPSIVSKTDYDRAVGTKEGKRASRPTREQMQREYEERPLGKILNREEFLAYYFPDWAKLV